ncbi:DNA polymerase epsilon subunit 3 [Liasis olivaceus]
MAPCPGRAPLGAWPAARRMLGEPPEVPGAARASFGLRAGERSGARAGAQRRRLGPARSRPGESCPGAFPPRGRAKGTQIPSEANGGPPGGPPARPQARGMAERPEDLNLPNAVVARIIKDALPDGVNVSREARSAISRAASVFVLYATSCANNFARKGKRKTLNAGDVISAMEEMEFQRFVGPLKESLEAYRNEQKGKRGASELKKKDKEKKEDSEDPDKNREEENEEEGERMEEEEEEEQQQNEEEEEEEQQQNEEEQEEVES